MVKVLWEEMSRPEIEEVQKRSPNAVILPTGSTEQHSYHLPVNVDARCVSYIAEQTARKVANEHNIPVLVLPTVAYGETATFRNFPGTLGLRPDTFTNVIEDIVRSLVVNQGFKNIIVLNGHNNNTPLITTALRKVSIEFPDAALYGVNWWTLGVDVMLAIRKSDVSSHAAEVETSFSLVIQPENVQFDKAVKDVPSFSLSSRWVLPDVLLSPNRVFFHSRKKSPQRPGEVPGVVGDPTVASRETGEKMLAAVIDDLIKLILEIVSSAETQ